MDSATKEVLLHFYSCEDLPVYMASCSNLDASSDSTNIFQKYQSPINERMAGLMEIVDLIGRFIRHHQNHYSCNHDADSCGMNVASTVGNYCLFEEEFQRLGLLVTGCLDDLELLLEAGEETQPDTRLLEHHRTLVESFNRMPNLYADMDAYIKSVGKRLINQSIITRNLRARLEEFLKAPVCVPVDVEPKPSFTENIKENDLYLNASCQQDAMFAVVRLLSIPTIPEVTDWRKHIAALPYVGCEISIESKEALPACENDSWRIVRFYLPAKYAQRHPDYVVGEPVQPIIRLPFQDFKIQPAATIQDAAAFFEEFLQNWDDRCIYLRTHPFGSNILMSHNASLYQELDYWRPQSNTMWPRFFCKT
eukprot:Platyproteum_vivax@DN2984_c0_g1_i1.p1